MKATDQIKRAALNKAIDYLLENPERNVAKIMDMIDKVAPDDVFPTQRAAFHQAIDDESNWYQLIMKILTDMNPQVRDRLIKTFVVDANMLAWPKQEAMRDQYHCNIPWAILLDPTSACNLRCTGCWAAEYGHKQNLTYEEIDSIINQGVKLGTHVYIYTGGEPLVRKHDLINLCEAHPDCAFLSFTNATLTDARRGEGTYAKVSRAMELLRENGLPFGVSCCYTSANANSIASEEFFDWLIEKGALFAWVFTYMPVGVGSPTSLMVHADQREHLYRFIREMREKKPLFTLDFQNDGEFVGGCIAGGRRYLHINAAGDVEPCVFAHYANVNIRETSLLDALRSPLFMQYYEGQPFNDNLLKPCPILENEGLLADMVKRAGAHSTDLQEKESAEDLCAKCHDSIAEWTPVAERIWNDKGDPLYDKRKNDPTQGMADTDMRKLAEQGRRELPESLMTKRERREHRKQREDATDVA